MLKVFSSKQAALLAATSLCAVFMTGCANMVNTAALSPEPAKAGALSGTLYGGSQAIIGSNLTLWAAGATGYGTGAVSLATTTTSGTGSFGFSGGYTCPTSTSVSQMIYITASGGTTGGVTNPNIGLMVALGDCATIKAANPVTNIDEISTIAAMAALHNFATLGAGAGNTLVTLGAPSSNLLGLKNAFATANNVVPYTGGTQPSIVTGTVSGFATAPSVTITPEVSKVNLEGNILAACVQTVSNCTTLFNDVNSAPALDTLQAAYYMETNITSTVNGTSNIAAIFALETATSPFAPAQSTAPTDWTIGVTYGSNSTSTASNYFMTSPEYVAIDGTGNLWIANYISPTGTSAGSVVELSPSGTPLNQVLVGSVSGPAGIVLDPSGNVWVPNFGLSTALNSTVIEYVAASATANSYTVSPGPQSLVSDGAGNIFTLSPSYKGAGAVTEIPAGTATGTTLTAFATGVTTDFSGLTIDSNDTIWVTGGGTGAAGGTAGYPAVYQFLYNSTSKSYPSTPSTTTTAGSITEPETGIAVDGSNNVWIGNYSKSTISEFSGLGNVTGSANSPITSTGLTKPQFGVFDGAGSYWVTNAVSSAGSVFGYSSAGVALTPTVGLTHTFKTADGIAVDRSGNIWVGNQSAASASAQGYVTEIVGGAVPVLTPISAGLPVTAGGTNKLASKP